MKYYFMSYESRTDAGFVSANGDLISKFEYNKTPVEIYYSMVESINGDFPANDKLNIIAFNRVD